MKPTPRPWIAHYRQVFGPHGMVIAETVSVGGDTPTSRRESLVRAEDDAKIIAALPDRLAELLAVIDAHAPVPVDPSRRDYLNGLQRGQVENARVMLAALADG